MNLILNVVREIVLNADVQESYTYNTEYKLLIQVVRQ